MTHSAKILADSISPDGARLTTLEVTFPRIVLAEFNTHRMLWGTEGSDYPEFSRNSASSRAIPVEKMIRMVEEHPYIPTHWGKNQKGMQAEEELGPSEQKFARDAWLEARERAVVFARALLDIGVHKQITNRLLEPFMWHTVIVTATEWDNFFHLRMNSAAHPEIQKAAELMHTVMALSEPKLVDYGQWHLPLLQSDEQVHIQEEHRRGNTSMLWKDWCKISVGRCARVSYLTHDGQRLPFKDRELHDQLLAAGHMSPFEHVARPATREDYRIARADLSAVPGEPLDVNDVDPRDMWFGNFHGWVQYRKTIPNEHDILGVR